MVNLDFFLTRLDAKGKKSDPTNLLNLKWWLVGNGDVHPIIEPMMKGMDSFQKYIVWVWPPPKMPVASEGKTKIPFVNIVTSGKLT